MTWEYGTTWEYKMSRFLSRADLTNMLNALGAEGWELTTVIREDLGNNWTAFFKRQTSPLDRDLSVEATGSHDR